MSVKGEIKSEVYEESAGTLQDGQSNKPLGGFKFTQLPVSCLKVETKYEVGDICIETSQDENKNSTHGPRRIRRPWITEEFMRMIEWRDELHSRLKKNPDNVLLKKEFSIFRNQTAAQRRKLKLAYQLYLEEL